MPKYMLPLKGVIIDFASMGDGDGRNQTLYNYILALQNNDFEIEEIRQCIRIINRYVLKTPLDERELESILRDDAFKKKTFFKDKTFLHDEFATYIKNNNHIIKINGQLHI